MKNKPIFGAGFALFLICTGASAGTVSFDTNSYNFPLDGGGGGVTATLNGVPVQAFCDDFANDISASGNYTANVTILGTSADLSKTRFGGVSSNAWTTISLDSGTSTENSQDQAFFNSGSGSSGLARYEMAAYLVSLYNPALGDNTSNNQIQEALWTEMNPIAGKTLINPSGVDASSDLEQAAIWYRNMNTAQNQGTLNSFLANYEIVSAADMTFTHGLGRGGFQEQIVMTPEPRGGIWLLLGLLAGTVFVARQRERKLTLQRA